MHNGPSDAQRFATDSGLMALSPADALMTPVDPKQENRIAAALRKPGEYLNAAIQNMKGRDLETLIEEYTNDVTLVLGGLSDDQEQLGRECSRINQESDRLRKQLYALEKRVAAMEKRTEKRPERDGLIRRLTWLAAAVFGGMALLYVVKFLLT